MKTLGTIVFASIVVGLHVLLYASAFALTGWTVWQCLAAFLILVYVVGFFGMVVYCAVEAVIARHVPKDLQLSDAHKEYLRQKQEWLREGREVFSRGAMK